ncbi:YciC family protein, partial [Kosakonia cowanii]|uniref:YciC family protein n=1 Tax=Kosakonia cowanii TaxID=208223 RepID=UPI0039B03FF3
MSITAKCVYRDTGDFLRYQFITILLIVLSCTVITAVIGHVLSPSEEQFSSVMDADNQAETKMYLINKY